MGDALQGGHLGAEVGEGGPGGEVQHVGALGAAHEDLHGGGGDVGRVDAVEVSRKRGSVTRWRAKKGEKRTPGKYRFCFLIKNFSQN